MNYLRRFFKKNNSEESLKVLLGSWYDRLSTVSKIRKADFVGFFEDKFLPEYESLKASLLNPPIKKIIDEQVRNKVQEIIKKELNLNKTKLS